MIRKIILLLLILTTVSYSAVKDLQTYVGNFSRGLTSIDQYYAIPNSVQNVENYYYDDNGLLNARKKWDRYISTGNDTQIDSMFMYRETDGTIHYLASVSKLLVEFTSINSTVLDLPETVSINTNYYRSFFTSKGQCYFGDGINSNMKYNGIDVQLSGIESPISTPTTTDSSVASSGIDSGTYKYRYTFYSDTNNWFATESNPNESYKQIVINDTDKNSAVQVGNLSVSSNPMVTHKRIYRTKKTGIELYYLVGTVSNTETVFVDTANDTELGLTSLTTTDREVFPKCKYFVEYKGIIFGAGNISNPSRIYFSEFSSRGSEPEYWEDFNYIDEESGDDITGLAVVNGHLVFFTVKKTYALYIPDEYITDPTYWRYYVHSKSVGCISQKSIQNTENGIIFLSNQGLYAFNVNFVGDKTSDGKFQYLGLEIKKQYDDYMFKYPERVRSNFHNHFYYLSYSENGEYNNKIYVYNTVSANGSFYSGISASDFFYDIYNDLFIAGSDLKDGMIMRLETDGGQDGLIYILNYTVDSTSLFYNDIYSGTTMILYFNERLTDTETASDTSLIDGMKGQALYLFNSDSSYSDIYFIIDNGTNTITILDYNDNCTTGVIIKVGSSNHIIETNYLDFGDATVTKRLQYVWVDLFAQEGQVEIYTYLDSDELYDWQLVSNQGGNEIIWDSVWSWDNDFKWDEGGLQTRFKTSIKLEVQFERCKFRFFINTNLPISCNRFYAFYKQERIKYIEQ